MDRRLTVLPIHAGVSNTEISGAVHPVQYGKSSVQCPRPSSVAVQPNSAKTMSQPEQNIPGITVYSDEVSMGSGSGSNGAPAVTAVVPHSVEEPEASLVPQTMMQRPSEELFGGQRIFLHAPQYHWHVQGAVGVDDEARQQVVALAEQLYQFGHRTEAREMDLWGRLQNMMETSGVHQLVAQLEQTMQAETTSFAERVFQYVDESAERLEKNLAAHWKETKGLQAQIPVLQQQDNQAGNRLDQLEKKLENMRVAQATFARNLVNDAKKALSEQVDQKVVAVQAELTQQINEVRQYLHETLTELKEEAATVTQSQERMWEVISRMGEDVRGVAEKVGSGRLFPIPESDEDPDTPSVENTPIAEGVAGPSMGTSPPPGCTIDETEEESSVKDSVTSGVTMRKPGEGSTGVRPEGIAEKGTTQSDVCGAWVFEDKTVASTGENEEKGGVFIGDPMVTQRMAPLDYSESVSDTVSLVGKGPTMTGPVSGGSTPHAAGVGQMKLEAPPRYSGKKQPSVRTWLSQMERYMRLMKYDPTDWLDVVAMRVDGAASSWVTAVLQEVANGRRQAFRTWGQFKVAMIHRFESITETEDARRQLRTLKQTGRVGGYIQKFQELQYRLPSMTDEEAFHAFLSGLVPHLQEHVGAHVQGDLEQAMAMAQRLEAYKGGDGAKAGGTKGSRKFKKQNKQGNVAQVQGSTSGGTVLVVQGQQNQKQGKGRQSNQQKKKQKRRGGQFQGKCYNCGGNHAMRDCQEWKDLKKKLQSSGN